MNEINLILELCLFGFIEIGFIFEYAVASEKKHIENLGFQILAFEPLAFNKV